VAGGPSWQHLGSVARTLPVQLASKDATLVLPASGSCAWWPPAVDWNAEARPAKFSAILRHQSMRTA